MADKRFSTIFTVVVYAAVAGMLVFGYFETREKPEQPTDSLKTEIVIQGAIKPIGVNMKNVATHILIKDDASVVILDGAGMDLDKYIGEKRVSVRGTMELGPSNKEILRVSDINIAPEPEIKKPEDYNQPVGWDIYKSASVGVSVKYKKDWEIETAAKSFSFKLPEQVENGAVGGAGAGDGVIQLEQKFDIITFEILSSTQSLDNYIVSLNDSTIQKSKIGLDSTAAYKRVLGGKITYYAERESKYIYKISYIPAANKPFDPNRNTFYEIISTLRFIPFATS
ncbi:hypothetical protein HZA39_03100 [Candidatus Peregrinibacteria bacterium]|nr:hypothetical protein [Candidatus Peregrinibacteria bacterium]